MLSLIQEAKQAQSTVIRVGDRVVVTVPEFVERVGYPLSFEDAKRWVLDYQYADITRLTGDSNWVYTTQGQRLLSSLAKFYQRRMKFGGRERTLHLYRESDKLGKVYEVIDRKVVTTGTYYSDPPELAGAKKHVLFKLRDPASLLQIRPAGWTGLWIERCNIKKM